MNIAIVGCGFVADYYLSALKLHRELVVVGVTDRIAERAMLLAKAYRTRGYQSLEELLGDDRVQLVLNLTNPASHYDVSKLALLANKHVYSEKPLAMRMADAVELVELAESRGLLLVSAPCSVLGETAQTLWRLIRKETIGRVRLVYAEMDDGMVPVMPYHQWKSSSGIPWPYQDEFNVGCTLEHAGYYLSWLAAWFGPAVAVSGFASVQIPEKIRGQEHAGMAPDFSVACIQFGSGIVARLTCSIVAPHDHSLRVVTDRGILFTRDAWDYRSPVYSRRLITLRRKTILSPLRTRHRLLSPPLALPKRFGAQRMDFARGPAEMAAALREGRPCRLSPRLSLHVNELALAIHEASGHGRYHEMTTTFDPIEPMPWSC